MKDFNKFCLILAMAGLTTLMTGTANAETFSFTSSAEVTNQVMMTLPNGAVAGAVWVNGKSEATNSKRGKITSTFACGSSTNPPSDLFHTRQFCEVTEEDGSAFGIFSGCNFLNKERSEQNCVGGLVGKTGVYKDRRGTISWNNKSDAPGGKKSTAVGAGVWNE